MDNIVIISYYLSSLAQLSFCLSSHIFSDAFTTRHYLVTSYYDRTVIVVVLSDLPGVLLPLPIFGLLVGLVGRRV